jgi:predicted N-formylglutamate amidohydrolase
VHSTSYSNALSQFELTKVVNAIPTLCLRYNYAAESSEADQIDEIDDVTIPRQGVAMNLPTALIEMRQDRLSSREQVLQMTEILADVFDAASAALTSQQT